MKIENRDNYSLVVAEDDDAVHADYNILMGDDDDSFFLQSDLREMRKKLKSFF